MYEVPEVNLASPSLESLDLTCTKVLPRTQTPSFPRMLALTISCEDVHDNLFEGLPVLESLSIGLRCMVRASPAVTVIVF